MEKAAFEQIKMSQGQSLLTFKSSIFMKCQFPQFKRTFATALTYCVDVDDPLTWKYKCIEMIFVEHWLPESLFGMYYGMVMERFDIFLSLGNGTCVLIL